MGLCCFCILTTITYCPRLMYTSPFHTPTGLSLLGVWFKMNQGHLSVVVKQVWDKIVPKDILKVSKISRETNIKN